MGISRRGFFLGLLGAPLAVPAIGSSQVSVSGRGVMEVTDITVKPWGSIRAYSVPVVSGARANVYRQKADGSWAPVPRADWDKG